MAEDKRKNPFVGIAAVVGGMTVAIVAISAAFFSNQPWALAAIVWGMAFMAVGLGYFASKQK